MGFAVELTNEEAAAGFAVVEHEAHGPLVVADVGNGLRAVKVHDGGAILYAICDASLMMLYRPARSLFELAHRFGLGVGSRVG